MILHTIDLALRNLYFDTESYQNAYRIAIHIRNRTLMYSNAGACGDPAHDRARNAESYGEDSGFNRVYISGFKHMFVTIRIETRNTKAGVCGGPAHDRAGCTVSSFS